MAKKRPALPEQPPSPSSSEEAETQKQSSSSSEEPQNPSSNKPKSDEPDSDSEEVDSGGSDSAGSESDDDDVPVKHMLAPRTTETTTTTTTSNIKPISSKPMSTDSSSKPKKPVSTNTTVFALVAKKDKTSDKDTRKERKKKKVSELEEEKKKGDVDKKNAVAKLWSENDEAVILKGLIEFKKKGKNASSDLTGFLEFIKEGLDADVTRDQLKSKLQRLKQKYQSSSGGFTKPHEVKLFEMSKQIWGEKSGGVVDAGNNGAGDSVVEDGMKRKRQKSANGVALQKKGDTPMVEVKAEDNGNGSGYLYLNASTLQGHLIKPPQELGEVFLKNGWDLVGNANAKELDKRWKTVMIAETKAYIQRLDLVRDQTKLMLEALESSNL